MTPLAVAIIHGVEIDDPHFADRAVQKLRHHFAAGLPKGAAADLDRILHIEPVHWAPILERRQKDLIEKLYTGSAPRLFNRIRRLVLRLNQGSIAALGPFVATMAARFLPRIEGPHYPGLRWMAMHFMGDIVAYESGGTSSRTYEAVHDVFADALRALAGRAGADAPLCVLAHSYGSVIASDFFYDLGRGKRPGGSTPLERGHTLSHFYTMGSPMALWSLRYDEDLDRPIKVPAAELADIHPRLDGEWVNFYDPDDVIAFPLKGLSGAYREAVSRDERVSLCVPPVSWLPLVHPFYWSDDAVMEPIGRALARAWRQVN